MKSAIEILNECFAANLNESELMPIKSTHEIVLEAMETYAAQFYTETELTTIINQVLQDAEERLADYLGPIDESCDAQYQQGIQRGLIEIKKTDFSKYLKR